MLRPCHGYLSWILVVLSGLAPGAAALAADAPDARAPAGEAAPPAGSVGLPVRGLHLAAPARKDVGLAVEFIRTVLPREGVNTLILEFDYAYDFQSLPEFSNPSAPGKDEVRRIAEACRESGIELIPQMNCLGHQSWAERDDRLLQKHPEFDETPGKYPKNEGIYCRSYCPLHPEVHRVLFALMDELIRDCGAKSFHVGMDEVFILADPDCPRCRGKDPADLLAREVETLHAHVSGLGCTLWMWGDRFLDGKATGIGKWEASENGTHPAIDRLPKDVIICDWHYEKAHDTAQLFARKGIRVVECPWRKPDVARAQLEQIRALRANDDPALSSRALGMVQTTWCGFVPFVEAYRAQAGGAAPGTGGAAESARCFRELFAAIRGKP